MLTREQVKQKLQREREGRASLSSSALKTTTGNDIRRRLAEERISKALPKAYETINAAYSGWHTQDEMQQYKSQLADISSQLTDYSDRFGSSFTDANKGIVNAYLDTIGKLDDLTELYGYYQNADAYNNARQKKEFDDKYAGNSYEDIQAALAMATGDERKYLQNYTNYSSIEDFEKALEAQGTSKGIFARETDLEKAFNMYKRKNAYEKYADLVNNPDFATASRYNPAYTATDADALSNGMNEAVYRYANNDESFISEVLSSLGGFDFDKRTIVRNMTDEQRAMFNYIYNTQGGNAAWDYIENMQGAIMEPVYNETVDWLQETIDSNSWLKNVWLSAAGDLAQFGAATNLGSEAARSVLDDNYSPYVGASGVINMAADVNAQITQKYKDANPDMEILGVNIPAVLTGAATSGIQSRIGQRIFGKPYNAIMGLNSYINAYKDAYESGASAEKIIENAAVAGLTEFLTEEIGFDAAFGTSRNALVQALKSFGAEASEELVGSLVNYANDLITNGVVSEVKENIQAYIEQGYSAEDANRMAWRDYFGSVAEGAIAAGLSGGVEGGAYQAVSSANARATGAAVDVTKLDAATQGLEANNQLQGVREKYNNDFTSRNARKDLGYVVEDALKEDASKSEKSDYESKATDIIMSGKTTAQLKAENKAKRFKTAATTNVDGEAAKLQSVKKDGNKITVVTDKGEYDSKRIELSKADAYIVARAADIQDAEKAAAFVSNYDGSDVTRYDNAFELAYRYGQKEMGISALKEDVANGTININVQTAADIYQAGVAARNTQDKAVAAAQKELKAKWSGTFRQGTFNTDSIDVASLNASERMLLNYAEIFSMVGINVNVIKDSSDSSINGKYDAAKNEVTFNLAARYAKDGDIFDRRFAVSTMSHELTHWMEDKATEEYKALQNAIFSYYAAIGVNVDDLIAAQQQAYEKNHEGKLSRKAATSEVIARACEDMLNNPDTINQVLSNVSIEEARGIKAAISKFFEQIKRFLEDMMAGYGSMSREAQLLRRSAENFEDIRKQWIKALNAAIEFNQALNETVKPAEETLNSDKADMEYTVEGVSNKLMAYHNLDEASLLKTIKLGGFAMPSIAIKMAELGHYDYGPISVIFGKSTINPANNAANNIYSGDAWTPTFPTVDVKINSNKLAAIRDKVTDLVGGWETYNRVLHGANLDNDNASDMFNRNRSAANNYANNKTLQYAYLMDTGNGFEIPMKEKKLHPDLSNEAIGAMAKVIGADALEEARQNGYEWQKNNKDIVDKIRVLANEASLRAYDANVANGTKKENAKLREFFATQFDTDGELSFSDFDKLTNAMRRSLGPVETEVDTVAFSNMLNEKVDKEAYSNWLDNLFEGIIEKEGIRNNLDMFMSNGNRRSWDALHWELTLENVVKAMRQQDKQGAAGFFGGQNIWGVATRRYTSIADMRKDIARLVHQNEEERDELRSGFTDRLIAISEDIMNKKADNQFTEYDRAAEAIVESLRGAKTTEAINRELKQWRGLNIKEDTAQQILDLYNEILQMPTDYFEAKPARAVGLDEIAYVVIPSTSSQELKDALNENSIEYHEYEHNDKDITDNADRVRVTNEAAAASDKEVLFSDKVDSEGNTLTDAQAEYFKDSKVRDTKGNLQLMYHGTPAEFTVFDRKKARSSGTFGNGFYFSTSEGHAGTYGKTLKGYLNIVNPIMPGRKTITNAQLKKFVNAIAENEDYGLDNYGYGKTAADVVDMLKGKDDFFIMLDLNATAIGNAAEAIEFFNEVNGTDFDGIISSTESVALRSNQFKNADNVNPTSSEDIRYSDKEDSIGEKLSESQAEYFKDSKVRDAKGRLQHLYHGSRSGAFSVFDTEAGAWLSTNRHYALEYSDYFSQYDKQNTGLESEVYDNQLDRIGYGDRIYSVYANITKPLDIGYINGFLSDSLLQDLSKRIGITDVEDHQALFDIKKKMPVAEAWEFTRTKEFQDIVKKYGYNGLRALEGYREYIETYCAFYPEQIKLTSNLNPTEDTDIRYSDKSEALDYMSKSERVDSDGNKLSNNQISFFRQSKVRDESGALKVMYHGTREAGFETFDTEKSDDKISLFFTDSKEVASTYSGVEDIPEDIADYSFYELAELYETNITDGIVLQKDDKYIVNKLVGGKFDKQAEFDTLDGLREFIISKLDRSNDISAANYKVYLNIVNPLEIDADGNAWDGIDGEAAGIDLVNYDNDELFDKIEFVKWNGNKVLVEWALTGGRGGDSEWIDFSDIAARFGSDVYDEIAEKHKGSHKTFRRIAVKPDGRYVDLDSYYSTRDIARYAYESGYDGVIIKNLYDSGSYGDADASTVCIAFNANQVKNIDNVNPTDDANIYYSEKVDSELYNILGEKNRLLKENAKLRKDVKRLDEKLKLQRKVTKGMVLKDSDLELVARTILKDAKSTYEKAELIEGLREVYNYILENSSGDNQIDWEIMMGKAYAVAARVMNKAKPEKIVDDYYKMILNDIRKTRISLDAAQIQEAKNVYGNKYRDAFMGRVVLAKNGTPLDIMWQSWAENYPGVFDSDTNSADMLVELSNIYDEVKDASTVLQYFNDTQSKRAMAEEIYEKFWNVSTVNTIADKYAAQIKRLNFEHRQDMAELKKKANEKRKTDRAYYHNVLQKVREQRDKKIADLKEYQRKREADRKEAAKKRAAITKITDTCLLLSKWLTENSKKNHIPETLKAPVAEFVGAIDYSSKQMLNTLTPTKKDVSIARAMQRVRDAVSRASGAQTSEDYVSDLATYIDFPPQYVEELTKISEDINDIQRRTGEDNAFILQEMTADQLEELLQATIILKHSVTQMNKIISRANAHSVDYYGQKSIRDAADSGKASTNVIKRGVAYFLNYNNGLPYYVFKKFGGGASEMFSLLQDGWDRFAFNIQNVIDYANDAYTSEEVNEWEKEVHDFTVLEVPTEAEKAEGAENRERDIQMTTAQIMSLYCLAKREQARGHMLGGGIRIAEFGTGLNKVNQADAVTLTESELVRILGTLTARQKEVADALQEYMNTVCSDWGNEVTMKRFGINAFTEKNYFPIKSDSNVLRADVRDDAQSIYKLLNMSFTKPLVQKANNQIVIDSIFSVFSTHASDMAKYNSLALPVLDMIKWWNYKEAENRGEDAFTTQTVKASFESAYGKDANKYIRTFLMDLNGATSGGSYDFKGKKLAKGYKAAAVGANVLTALLQPISYIRAGYVMDAKYLAKAMLRPSSMEKVESLSGIGIWKGLNLFDTNVSRGIDHKIKHDDTWVSSIIEKSMKLAELGDKWTWGKLWNACEIEVSEKQHLPIGSEEYNRAVADRFREVIYSTQVVDSTMTRSDIMRSKDYFAQTITAFMSEPTVSINMLLNAGETFNAEYRKNGLQSAMQKQGKTIAKAAEVYIIAAVVESAMRAAIGKLRDKEDDSEYLELLWANLQDELLLFNKVPYIKDIISIFQGYSASRMDTAAITSIYYAIKALDKSHDEGWTYRTTYKILDAVSKATGLPMANAMRELATVWNNTIGLMYPDLQLNK